MSSLYTFLLIVGLARRWHIKAFSEFTRIHIKYPYFSAQIYYKSPVATNYTIVPLNVSSRIFGAHSGIRIPTTFVLSEVPHTNWVKWALYVTFGYRLGSNQRSIIRIEVHLAAA